MPSGFTCIIEDGDPTFREFAWRCARAFGALYTVTRERGLDASVPVKLVPDSYHEKEVSRAKLQLLAVESMSNSEAEYEAKREHEVFMRSRTGSIDGARIKVAKYDKMLAEVQAWEPPTPDHVRLKEFMVEQIEESVGYDRRRIEEHQEDRPVEPPQTGDEYRSARKKIAEDSIKYHQKEWEEECKRTKDRNDWLMALRASVGDPP